MADDFEVAIGRFVEKANSRIQGFCIEFVQDINEEIIRATPVDTGFLRASWWGAIDSPEIRAAVKGAEDKAGSGTVARLNLTVATDPVAGHAYFLMNGAKYAMRVEYGFVGTDKLGRRYNQAPRAFVRGTLMRADQIAEATAIRIAT